MPQFDRSWVSTTKFLTPVVVDADYYGASSVTVPFKWESQPGTPRRLFSTDSDSDSPVSAPLTPPPSYFYASLTKPNASSTLFGSFLPKNRSRRGSSTPSSPASSSSGSISPIRRSESGSSFDYGSNRYNNAKSSGCYASIFKALLK